jgi:hypothetical protein
MAVTLPWLLAGPIIRRAEPDVVWIWLATSWSIVECQPWVIVTTRRGEKFDDVGLAAPADAWPDRIDPQKRLHEVFESGFRCVPLGQRLFVTLVPLRPKRPFARGTIYGYGMSLKLSADAGELKVELAPGGPLGKPVLLSSDVIAYQPWKWPTFSLPRSIAPFVHGSCRRPGAAGDDAYPTLHAWLVPEMARDRPQAVFLTGDQIYADDLAGPLWGAIQDLARDLLGTVELMPLLSRVQAVQEYRADTQARPISDFQYTPQSQVKQPPPTSSTSSEGETASLGLRRCTSAS